jgi:hypothetical protein
MDRIGQRTIMTMGLIMIALADGLCHFHILDGLL